jgi:hypothetical protein
MSSFQAISIISTNWNPSPWSLVISQKLDLYNVELFHERFPSSLPTGKEKQFQIPGIWRA